MKSHRASQRIDTLWAVVTVDPIDGTEGVVRRDTPYGTQPYITDDDTLLIDLVRMAQIALPGAALRIAQFTRRVGRDRPVVRV